MHGKYRAYPEYKTAESKWLDKVPVHWGRAPLKNVVSIRITDGPHETPIFVEEGVPFLSAEAVKNNSLEFSRKRGYITRALHGLYSQKCLPKIDDIFMVKSGNTTGNVAIVETEEEFNIWSPLALIRANKAKVLPRFIFYSMLSDFFRSSVELSWSKGTQPNIGMGVIENLHIATAPLEEQSAIINFLDYETAKIDTLIEKQQQLITLLKEKRQAVISHAVTKGLNPDVPMRDSGVEWLGQVPEHWEVVSIKHLSTVKRGASPRPIDDPKYFDEKGEYAWVRIYDVSKAGMYLTKTTQRLSNLGASLSVKLQEHQLFVSIAGTVGKPCIATSKVCIHDGFVYFPELSINSKYLYYIFEAGEAYLGLGKMGTQLNLNTETVGGIKIGLPPEKEMEQVIEFIENSNQKYDVLISKAQLSIKLMQERRTALISAAVTGKIDVRN